MIRRALPDLGILVVLLLLPLLLFAPVALGSKTLLPVDTLFLFEPYRAASGELGVAFPQNHLVADLILENYAWKRLLVEALESGELPLWDPYIFAGHPFLANGQHSALYPLSAVFYVLPLWRAYGVFAWLQLGLAGIFTFVLARVLGVGRLGGLIAGITFQLSGFMVASVVHLMIIASASWLPFVLAMVELIVQQRPALGRRPASLPWALLGAVGLGCQMLAGHAENTYLALLVTGAYVAWRLCARPLERTPGQGWLASWLSASRRPITWIAVMLVLGLALGAVQFVPLYGEVTGSFRGGEAAASLQQVRGWAYPWRRLITFGVPNFFGNPTHHGYFDLFTWRPAPALSSPYGRFIDWGVKNYVEGGAYLGLLPLLLAAIAAGWWVKAHRVHLASALSRITHRAARPASGAPSSAALSVPFFALLALFSLGCIFGTPLYALVYALPFFKQSHSPFRWVFPLTLSVAVLAGFGAEIVRGAPVKGAPRRKRRFLSGVANLLLLGRPRSAVSLTGALALWGGLATLGGLALSRVIFAPIEPLVSRLFHSLALAPVAFSDHRAFYSYEFKWVALFGLLLAATGAVLLVSRCAAFARHRHLWDVLAVVLLLVDFLNFGLGVNPAVDRGLLAYVPPAVRFLWEDTSVWRYATFTPPGTTKTMNANAGMFYGLQTIAGYDSLFSRQYADYMGLIEPQDELQYNRIASLRQWSSLDSPLTDLLNVKYVITEVEIPNPAKYRQVYQDAGVRVYQNLAALPRAFTLPVRSSVVVDDVADALRHYDPHQYVIVEAPGAPPEARTSAPVPGEPQAATGHRQSLNEVVVEVEVGAGEPSWLVLADSYAVGWRAYVRPQGGSEDAERQVEVHRVNGNFRGVLLEPGAWTVRFKYSPDNVKVGAFVSFIAGMMVLFLAGIYLWRFFYREQDDATTVRRVAKNSIAPIVINLFTRLIEMAFAALMARILGPVGNGRYATAISIYLWFDIVANFGLDMFLMREVARDRTRGRQLFVNTTVLRVLLFLAAAPLLVVFLAGRQALGQPLAGETVRAVGLLFLGLLPFSIANGLAALFRACEKHEYPAAIQTVTTIIKVTLGVLALVGGVGIAGLAGAAIVTNLATLAILALLARRLVWPEIPREGGRLRWALQRAMVIESWPLMASLLLQALFPGVNLLLLQRLQGDAVVGWYDAARKWVDAPSIVPSFFTFAVFPVMSRQAAQDRSGLQRSYRLSVKLLTMVALPLAVGVALLSAPLVGLLSGQRFLPDGALVLRLLIWSILPGWINSLTNYVLIALERQRYVLLASGARVAFTVVANLLLVRSFSYVASAWIITGGELLLLLLFTYDLRRQLKEIGLARALLRPLLAGLAMGAVALALAPVSHVGALLVSCAVYIAALVLLRVLTTEEWALLAPLLPKRVQQRLPFRRAGGG